MFIASQRHRNVTADECHHGRQQQQQQQQQATVCSRVKLNRRPLLELIADAILQSTDKRLLVNDIYQYIEDHSGIKEATASLLDSFDSTTRSSSDESNKSGDGSTVSTNDDTSLLRVKRDEIIVRRVVKEATWKVHVRHILSVRKTIFPLTNDKDGKRRGRFHTIDETKFYEYLASQIGRRSITPSGGRRRRSHPGFSAANENVKAYGHSGGSEMGEVGGLRPRCRDSYGLIGDNKHTHFYPSVTERVLYLREPHEFPQLTKNHTMTSWWRCSEQLQHEQPSFASHSPQPMSSPWQSSWQHSPLYQCQHFQANDNLDSRHYQNCHHHSQQQQQLLLQGSCSSTHRDYNTHHSTTNHISKSQLTVCGVLPTAVKINSLIEKEEHQVDLKSRNYLQLQSIECGTSNCQLAAAASGAFHQWDNERNGLRGYENPISMSGDRRPSPSHYGDPNTLVSGHGGMEEYHLRHHNRTGDTGSTSTMASYLAFCPSTIGDVRVMRLQPMETGSCFTECSDKTSGNVNLPSLLPSQTSGHITVTQHREWELSASPSNNMDWPLSADVLQPRSPERFSTCENYIENSSTLNHSRNTSIFGGFGVGIGYNYELSGVV